MEKKLFTCLMLITTCICINRVSAQNLIENKLDEYINSLSDKFNGTILLSVGDNILINKGYGTANFEYNIPNEGDTKYKIGSVSKHFTVILTLKLAELGLIDLNETIEKYLPEYPKPASEKITIHHLLMHQSGIGHHYKIIPEYFEKEDRLFHTRKEYLKLFWDKPLIHEPGKNRTYSSPGYYLLAVILERVSNKSYNELLNEYIFSPIKMNNSFSGNNMSIVKGKATGYKKGINGLVNCKDEEESNRIGAGNIISSSTDLYKFQKIFNYESDVVLSKKYKELLLKPQTPTFKGYDGNNLFLGYSSDVSQLTYQNDTLHILWKLAEGSSYGYRARITRFLEKDACYIVLSNVQVDNAMNQQLYSFLEDMLLEEMNINIKQVKSKGAWDKTLDKCNNPEKYEGFYSLSDKSFIQVFVDDKQLYCRILQNSYGFDKVSLDELLLEKNDVFRVKGLEDKRFSFAPDSLGNNFNIIIDNKGSIDTAIKVNISHNKNLNDFTGTYSSLELQKFYNFKISDGYINSKEFIDAKDALFIPLNEKILGCEYGFLIFNRDSDNNINGFKLINESIDAFTGSEFTKEW
jgi:CubicO group peptidase (beta-lactamase class C family)